MAYYIHKHKVAQFYGGPEEGGWWYEAGYPCEDWDTSLAKFEDADDAYAACRALNDAEYLRRENENRYEYTSVLSDHDDFFGYSVDDTPEMTIYPQERPHYE